MSLHPLILRLSYILDPTSPPDKAISLSVVACRWIRLLRDAPSTSTELFITGIHLAGIPKEYAADEGESFDTADVNIPISASEPAMY